MRYLALLVSFFATLTFACPLPQAPEGPQAPTKSAEAATAPDKSPGDPDNKHIHVERYIVPPHGEIALPKVTHESVFVCIHGDLKRVSEKQATESCDRGEALWGRGGASYRMDNEGESQGELIVVELKDSYAIDQVHAPGSERDPLAADPRRFRVLLENEHVRLTRLRLAPRQGTTESQFLMRFTIPLQPLHAEMTAAAGKTTETSEAVGAATWHESPRMFR